MGHGPVIPNASHTVLSFAGVDLSEDTIHKLRMMLEKMGIDYGTKVVLNATNPDKDNKEE